MKDDNPMSLFVEQLINFMRIGFFLFNMIYLIDKQK